jgi:molybdate transport system ATP-binding protein
MLEVDVKGRMGSFSLEAAFTAPPGITGLFGPSGSGKTSLLKMIAGLVRPQSGRILISGVVLFDADKGVNLDPDKRRIGMVFQDARLFPHMNVTRNLDYAAFLSRAKRNARFDEIVDVLDIRPLLLRMPKNLSGGERQRVAIGRALLAEPRILMLDEPLSSVDIGRREEILPYVKRLRDVANIPILHVSHDADEMMRLADTIVLMDKGRVTASGPAHALRNRLTPR